MQASLDILLVEDNEGDVEMTERAFSGENGCSLFVVNDGVEALDFLHKRGKFTESPLPHLILLDLNMPRMDGRQFLETVKTEGAFKAIPVIMLTSSESPADIKACYERHASMYVVKPFDGREFTDKLKQVMKLWNGVGRLPH